MRGLIYKDLYLTKSKMIVSIALSAFVIGLSLLVFAIAGKRFTDPNLVCGFIGIIIVFYIPEMNNSFIMKTDAEKEWSFYGMSLPGGIKQIVAAKYMTVFIQYLSAYVLCVLNDIIFGLYFGEPINSSIFVLFVIMIFILLNAVEMPIGFRFGFDKASQIRIFMTIVVVLIITVYLLFGNIDWLMADDGLVQVVKRVIDQVSDNPDVLSEEVQRLISKITYINYIYAAVLVHLVVLSYYISYRISCRVFRKGVLRDDN